MSSHFNQIANRRQQGKCDFTYNDILMSAFACMYFQDLSLLQFQKLIEEKQGRKNLSYNMYLLTLLAFFVIKYSNSRIWRTKPAGKSSAVSVTCGKYSEEICGNTCSTHGLTLWILS
jgi:hypothetical protein